MSIKDSVTLIQENNRKNKNNPPIISSVNQVITFYLGTRIGRLIHQSDYITDHYKLELYCTISSPLIASHSSAVKSEAVATGLSLLRNLLLGSKSSIRFSQNNVSSG